MLKKGSWILLIIMATLCSYLTANLISVYLQKKWDVPEEITFSIPKKEEATEQGRRLGDYYKVISQRDLFRILPIGKEEKKGTEEEVVNVTPLTDLKLKLLGTIVGEGIISYSIIKDLKTNKQDIYKEGDKIGLAEIIKIYRNKVLLRHEGTEEILVAFEKPETESESFSGVSEVSSPAAQAKEEGERASSIRMPMEMGQKIAPNHWVLKREEMQNIIDNSSQLLTQVRVIPHFKGGDIAQPDGFQMANIIPRSLFEKMGLQNGDVVKSVNGMPVNNPDKAFEAYQKFKNESNVQVTVLRNNKEVALRYDINE